MKKFYRKDNVHDASKERIKVIFDNFENIYISLSGGKDSGVMLNLVIDYMRENNITRKVGVLFIDLEAFYKKTIDFIKEIIESNNDILEPYWVCMPMLSVNSVSMYEPWWVFWEESKKDLWVRDMPTMDYVINIENHKFDFWRDRMLFEEFITLFGDWYAKINGGHDTACLVGIRTDESLNRFRSIIRDDKGKFNDLHYSTKVSDKTYNFYPIYDWSVEDIWIYNGKFNKLYNRTYDLFYQAGIPLSKQRICEPYGNEAKAGINLFKVVEPETWIKVVSRVSGANFGNIYTGTKALGMKYFKLPDGHTWKSYCKFLLSTLPEKTRLTYMDRFVKFMKWWHRKGSPIISEHIELLPKDLITNTKQYSNRGKGDKYVIKFRKIPDELPAVDTKFDAPTWKRMCMAILKNDITCKSLSFGLTKHELDIKKRAIERYKGL